MSELNFSQKKTPRELGYGLNDTANLRKLIMDHPELPLVVFAGQNACLPEWSTTLCASVYAYIGEFLDCEQDVNPERVYGDRDEFEDDLRQYYEDMDMNDDEFDDFIDKKLTDYEPFWKKCIILEVNN